MRIVLKLFKSLTLVFMVLVIVMFAINWSDQPPSAAALEMRSLLDQGSEIPDEDNAFVYAMGLPAPRASDPVSSGLECIAKLNTAVHKETINFETDLDCWDRSSSESDNATISKIFNVCGLPMQGQVCEKELQENEQVIARLLDDESWFLERYLGLLQRNKWHPTTEFSVYMPLPYYGSIGRGQKILMLKAWHLAGQGKVVALQRLLNQDAKFWRGVLSSSNMLIDKMLAAAYLTRHFAFSNLVMRRIHNSGVPLNVPEAWMVPMVDDELSLKKAMAGELEFFRNILVETKDPRTLLMGDSGSSASEEITVADEWLMDVNSYLLKNQATQNAHAEHMLQLSNMLDVPPRQLPQALEQADAYIKGLSGIGNLLSLYNPIGNVLTHVAMPAYSGFFERVHNLEGVRRAAMATVQLREKGVVADQVVSALSQSEFKNPYNGKPFEWNAETNSIIFKGLGSEERSTHSFLY